MRQIRRAAWLTALSLLLSLHLSAQYGTFSGLGMGVIQRQMEPQRMEFRPWVMLNATYWNNLAVIQDEGPSAPSGDVFGGMLGWGVSGGKTLERSAISVGYNGAARYISNHSGLGAFTNAGHFNYYKQLSKEWSTSTSIYGGTSAGSYGTAGGFGGLGGLGFNGFGMVSFFSPGGVGAFSDPQANGIADDEIVDNRIYFGSLRSALIYSPNFRWQVGGGVLGSIAQRTGKGLFDMNSAGAFGQAVYLIDRTTSVTAGYTYSRLWYPGVIRESAFHSIIGGISKAIDRRTMFSVSGGYSRFSATGATTIELDPLIAELLGSPTTVEIRSVNRNIMGIGARLNHVVTDRVVLMARYSRGLTPGNGLLLASARDMASFSVGYSADGRWTFSIGVVGTRANDLIQDNKDYLNAQGSGHLSFRMFGDFRATMGGGYRVARLPNLQYQRQAFAAVGIMWSPGGEAIRWF